MIVFHYYASVKENFAHIKVIKSGYVNALSLVLTNGINRTTTSAINVIDFQKTQT